MIGARRGGDLGKDCHRGYVLDGMPTRNISLTREQDAFIKKVVKAGEYQNASEAMRDALRALQQRRREDALKLAALRAELDKGVRDLEEGNYEEVESADVGRYLASLTPRRTRKRTR
jgi:antitoxin ParD1/3/4